MAQKTEQYTEEEGILPPKKDVVFKALFTRGKERITKAFLEDILKIKIKKLDLDKSKDLTNTNKKDKNGRLDLRAVLNDNIECDIEIQLAVHEKEIERFLYYWAKLYAANLQIGSDYKKLRKTISIIILGKNLEKLKKIPKSHSKWQIREENWQNVVLTEELELHIIELPKALEEYKKNPKDEVLQWMMFLENPEDVEVQKIMKENENIKEAKKELDTVSSIERGLRELEIDRIIIEADRQQFEMEARDAGLKAGMKERNGKAEEKNGRIEEKTEIAKKMLKEGMPIEQIVKITKLTKEEIEKLK